MPSDLDWRTMSAEGQRPGRQSGRSVGMAIFGLFIVICMTGIFALYQQFEIDRGAMGSWPIPGYQSLRQASGELLPPSKIRGPKSDHWAIGNLLTNDGELLSFSCLPSEDELECLYPQSYGQSALSGAHVTVRYFDMPQWVYPQYEVSLPGAASTFTEPRHAATIVMEVTPQGAQPVLTYEDSIARLKGYMAAHQPPLPWLSPILAHLEGRTAMNAAPQPSR